MVTPSATVTPGAEEDVRLDRRRRGRASVSWLKQTVSGAISVAPAEHRRAPRAAPGTCASAAASSRAVVDAEHLVGVGLDRRDRLPRRVGELDEVGQVIFALGVVVADLVEERRARRAAESHDAGIAEADRPLRRRGVLAPRGLRRAARPRRSAGHSRPGRPAGSRARRGRPLGERRAAAPRASPRSPTACRRRGRARRRAGGEAPCAPRARRGPCPSRSACSWTAACGACLADEGLAQRPASGPTTTAIRSRPPRRPRASTWPSIGSPPTLCMTLGRRGPHPRPLAGGKDDGEAGSLWPWRSSRPMV